MIVQEDDKIFSTLKTIVDFLGAAFDGVSANVGLFAAITSLSEASLGAGAGVCTPEAGNVGKLTNVCEL